MTKRNPEVTSSPFRFLDQSDRCLLTQETASELTQQNGNQLEVEHIIPRSAGKRHRRLFRNILQDATGRELSDMIESHENKICLCTKCHNKVDDGPTGKPQIYRLFGITGLINYIANYPRATNQELLTTQYFQWRLLFGTFKERLNLLQSQKKVPSQFADDYNRAEYLAHLYLYDWEQGKFEIHQLGNGNNKSYSYALDRSPVPIREVI